jgi:putative glutamine amidotransferase
MTVRIAIPEPSSLDAEYNARALPPYLAALRASGAEPVIVPLTESVECVPKMLEGAHGVLLPGSRFDVDPGIYGAAREPECAESDPARAVVDDLMLRHAFDRHKPTLAICYGIQSLNVWRGGTLIQNLRTGVDHQPGRFIAEAHAVRIEPRSELAKIRPVKAGDDEMVNSSHHQALARVGGRLKVTASSIADGVIEAVELDSAEHWVVGVQWHPERTYDSSALSHALFSEFVLRAAAWQPQVIEEPAVRG